MPTDFTPYASLAGGALIGLAAVLLMMLVGRIAGATGILAGLLFPSDARDWLWRAAMIAGMVTSPVLLVALGSKTPEIVVEAPTPLIAIGGLIVGVGVTLGSGCTSGHGVCGLARFSPRSLAAVLTFMATAAATVYVSRHIMGA
ncbi:MAG: YeeE/YedE family protein [Hyphomicrobiaceae bacterium]